LIEAGIAQDIEDGVRTLLALPQEDVQ